MTLASSTRVRHLTLACHLAAILIATTGPHLWAQDLLNDNIDFSGVTLQLVPFARMPNGFNDLISITTLNGTTYATTQEGAVFELPAVNEVSGNATLRLNLATAIQQATGRSMSGNSGQQGLQSIAFHPDFSHAGTPGYGKAYTTYLAQTPINAANTFYLGNSQRGGNVTGDGVLAEWTIDPDTFQLETTSYRELFRVKMPVYDHPIKQARFNPYARPGDEDYGLLYMTHGDSNIKHSPTDDPQDLDNALGKMIRINPLASGDSRYTIPDTNPFADSTNGSVLPEIYAYGFRNPHTYSFNQDAAGHVHILVGDIGRNNIEEVDLVVAGGNYGWTEREGTFVHRQLPDSNADAGYITGLSDLPANEADFQYIYPVAQFDHDANVSQVSSGNAIATGFVLSNSADPTLRNQLFLMNFATHDGNVYHADLSDMIDAVTQLDASNPDRDQPSDLTQAVLSQVHLALDHDNNPDTAAQMFDDFRTLLSSNRSDTRFGEGSFGEMYITSKRNGVVYLVTNSLPLFGDYNLNGTRDAADYTVWKDSFGTSGFHLAADGNGNGVVDAADYTIWKDRFGSSSADAALVSVPEPATATLAVAMVFVVLIATRERLGTAV
ncbi:MAG: PQQ-dependent sugar dehydrogenase [Pirellulaceae bacterium]|nr:PQQ-dependent sugar dehydrogenase [Planctomycetales bacterium]